MRIAARPGGGLVVSFAPLAADAGTVPLILRELSAELAGSARPQAPDYSLMAQWLNDLDQAPEGAGGRAYWQEVLAEGMQEWLDASTGAPGPPAEASWPVPARAADLDQVRELAGEAGLAALLAALWARQVGALRDAGRCLIGVYLDGRLEEDVLDLMGPLGRYAPVWFEEGDTAASARFAIDRAAENADMLSLDHAWRFRYAFDYLDLREPEVLRPVRVRSRSECVGVRLSVVELPAGPAIEVRAAPGTLISGQLLADRVGYALTALARGDAGAQIVTPHEAELLASLGRPPGPAHGTPGPVSARVRRHARSRPYAIAVSAPEGEITYRGLEQAVSSAGRQLAGSGVTAGCRVVIRLPRGLALIATLLAAWQSGATAVPVDPGIPAGRLAEIIGDCEPVAVIDTMPEDDGLAGSLPEAAGAEAGAEASAPAYIIYTSGSTGRPRGVQVGQPALAAHCAAIVTRLGIRARDRAALLASPGFDVAIEQICATLTAGATVCVLPQPLVAADELTRFIEDQRVSILNVTPSLWQVLAEHWESQGSRPESVRLLILGAERVSREHIGAARRLLPAATIWNAYGPTESVITATLHRIASPEDAGVIGRPVGGRIAAVRDRQGRLAPLGAVGELWLSGACLADGYVSDPGLTKRRFPVEDGVRWLRTGDFVTMLPDGSLRFLGRRDRQVKVRGQRVELDEVENRCQELPGVEAAAVCLGRDGELAAFVESGADAPQQALWPGLLAQLLPSYMCPGRLVVLERLPRLANGKVDYSGLAQEAARAPSAAAEPPATTWERAVARLWEETLRLPVIARDSDFFELGGHSLAAVRIVTRLRESSHPELRATDLFEHHTVRRFADFLESTGQGPDAPPAPAERAGPDYAYRPSHAQRRALVPQPLHRGRHLVPRPARAAYRAAPGVGRLPGRLVPARRPARGAAYHVLGS